jgi:transposase
MSTHQKAYRYRVLPTPEQESVFRQWVGARRWTYNHFLDRRVAHYQETGKSLTVSELCSVYDAAWAQLRFQLTYKAQAAGVPVVVIDPAYTSQRCHTCGHTERANRRSQALFCCMVCGHAAPADVNAARNIRERAAVRRPMVSSLRAEAQAQGL